MEHSESDPLFERLMSVCQDVFTAQHYEAAYHLLTAAMHVGQDIESETALARVSQVAIEQSEWINANAPESTMSSKSAHQRNGVDLYANAIRQASAHTSMIRENNRRKKMSILDSSTD